MLLETTFQRQKINPWAIQEEHQAAWCGLWWEVLLQGAAGSGWCLCCWVSVVMPSVWAGPLCFWSWRSGVCRKAQKGGPEPLRVTEDPSVCPQRGQSSVLMLSSGFCHQCCDGAEADGCCFGRGCSRCQQHIQGTLQAIVLTLHTAMSRLGWPWWQQSWTKPFVLFAVLMQ